MKTINWCFDEKLTMKQRSQLWRQNEFIPDVFFFLIQQAVVEPVAATLPKFYGLRTAGIAAPVWRTRDFGVFKFFLKMAITLFQCFAALECGALFGGPGAELAPLRTGLKIGFCRRALQAVDEPQNTHLPLQLRP